MIKKYYRKLYRTYLGKPLSKDEFRSILSNDLGISKGDSLLVHSSYGNLKAGFTPSEAVEILMDVVTEEGNILMPYYPEDSVRWLEEGNIFDVRSTPTRSGILSASFARYPEVKKSLHPIKSLAVWGRDRDYLISTHKISITPFDKNSPTYKLIWLNNSKSIGLGVFKYLAMHTAEDTIEEHPKYYSNISIKAKLIDENGEQGFLHTPYHRNVKVVPSCEYLRMTGCPDYNEIYYKNRRFYVSDLKKFYQHMVEMTKRNKTALHLNTKISRFIISNLNRI